jgi:cytochrome c oxidase subunit IV
MSDTEVRPEAEPHEPERRGAPARRPHGAHPTPREYVRIAIVLFVITVMEVSTYYLQPPRSILVPVLFVFTFIKFSLVVLWFMHLRFDSRMYSRFFVMGLATAITLYVVVLLLFGAFTGGD